MDAVVLSTEEVAVTVDPGRGADVLSIMARESGTELLFETPWRARADALREGTRHPVSADSAASWLERYRGGWQTLCPNAGAARTHRGAPWGFHGEASTVPWSVESATPTSVRMTTELFTAPVRIDRELRVTGARIHQRDLVHNLSRERIDIDYSAHPAFGRAFLGAGLTLDTDANTFVVDPEIDQRGLIPGSAHAWPWLATADGHRDLREVPGAPQRSALFGWLTDFDRGRVTMSSPAGVVAELEWDAAVLPYAWVWQELESDDAFPWFGRARVLAIEPASTPTSGRDRGRTLSIGAFDRAEIAMSLSIETSEMTIEASEKKEPA